MTGCQVYQVIEMNMDYLYQKVHYQKYDLSQVIQELENGQK